MLTAQAISKSFGGNRAVDDVSFTIEEGTITGLIGPNGAGKTTLFNCLAGLLRPTSGRLELRGERIDGLSPDRVFARGLARTFQIPRPFPEMTVIENVLVAPLDQEGERFWANWFTPGRVAAQERALSRPRGTGSISWASRISPISPPACSPAASASSWNSPACSSPSRASSCSTSREPGSIRAFSTRSSKRSWR
jgi:ABC-type Fe3+/spermidine/putrescine transport system ATPase subunit